MDIAIEWLNSNTGMEKLNQLLEIVDNLETIGVIDEKVQYPEGESYSDSIIVFTVPSTDLVKRMEGRISERSDEEQEERYCRQLKPK